MAMLSCKMAHKPAKYGRIQDGWASRSARSSDESLAADSKSDAKTSESKESGFLKKISAALANAKKFISRTIN